MKKLTLIATLFLASIAMNAQTNETSDIGNERVNILIPTHELEVNGTTKTNQSIVVNLTGIPSFVNAWIKGNY